MEIAAYVKEAASLASLIEKLDGYAEEGVELGIWRFVVPEFGEE